MKKICIFPYNHDFDTIQKYSGRLKGYSIHGLCSFHEDDIILREKFSKTGISYSNDVESPLEKSDELLLLNNDRNLKLDAYIKRINVALKKEKSVRMSKKTVFTAQTELFPTPM